MKYVVREVFKTVQGEGARAGTAAIFARFSGCNLWSGVPAHRAKGSGPCAAWCDTDFATGEKLTGAQLVERIEAAHGHGREPGWVVLTGGEPLLQVDTALLDTLHAAGWKAAVETNGTVDPGLLPRFDWVCVAPKYGTEFQAALPFAHEVKVVLPGVVGPGGWDAEGLAEIAFLSPGAHLFVQPQDPLTSPELVEATYLKRGLGGRDPLAATYAAHVARCLEHVDASPRWRISVQAHKTIGVR